MCWGQFSSAAYITAKVSKGGGEYVHKSLNEQQVANNYCDHKSILIPCLGGYIYFVELQVSVTR